MIGTILVIEDEQVVASSYNRALSSSYEVIQASNSSAALRILSENEISLIILDLNLNEDIDGIQLARIIKQKYPQVYILTISGVQDLNILKQAINNGDINYFLQKPVEFDVLLKSVKDGFNVIAKRDKLSRLISDTNYYEETNNLVSTIINRDYLEGVSDTEQEIIGIIVSRYTLPFYSKINSSYLNPKINDIMLTGLINAIIMMEKAVFYGQITLNQMNMHGVSIICEDITEFQIFYLIADIHSSIFDATKIRIDLINDEITNFVNGLTKIPKIAKGKSIFSDLLDPFVG